MGIEWKLCYFKDLNTTELYEILKLRSDVFVVEQNCVYPDVDGIDMQDDTIHVLGTSEGKIVSYGRIYGTDPGHIGRVVLAKEFRGTGESENLLAELVRVAKTVCSTVEIQAQVYVKNWYGKAGFKPIGEEYLEDGIPLVDMRLVFSD